MGSNHTIEADVVIVGGGPAGLAAAIAAKEAGTDSVLILERDSTLGGILNQCIHSGFGLHRFKEELTGPEYAQRDIDKVEELKIPYKLNTMVLDIGVDHTVLAMNKEDGLMEIKAKAVVLAMGCRERPRGAVGILGTRPAGVYTAGTAQKYVNIEGYLPGKEVVILGSGDIGLIMARRMTLEGAKVKAVIELLPYSGGLRRNIVQCLDDYDIPLYFSHTITEISGTDRLEAVTVMKVDENRKPIADTEWVIPCDTLLLSVGLIPENELSTNMGTELSAKTNGPIVNESLETNLEGVFAAGNVLHVHDLVDYVSEESFLAGKNAALYAQGKHHHAVGVPVTAGNGISYTVPNTIAPENVGDGIVVRFRVDNVYKEKALVLYLNNEKVRSVRKRVLAPGEMETLRITKDILSSVENLTSIRIALEEQ